MSMTAKKALLGLIALIGASLCAIANQIAPENSVNWILLAGCVYSVICMVFWLSALIDIIVSKAKAYKKSRR